MRISILNAGQGTDYLYGFVSALAREEDMHIEVVDADCSAGLIDRIPGVELFPLLGDNLSPQSLSKKIFRISRYYLRLLVYAATTRSDIFHIQWDNSLFLFDRTFLLLYYKLLGKKIVYTAHNVDKNKRDGHSGWFDGFSLKALYTIADAVIVHTDAMKNDLCGRFGVDPEKVKVIVHGLNVRVPSTGLTQAAARERMKIETASHVVLFFGLIDRYKGVDIAVKAFDKFSEKDASALFLVAGAPKRGDSYKDELVRRSDRLLRLGKIRFDLRPIPSDEVEAYCMAADCIVLPYRSIYQSGVLFLAYRFGLPVLAANVGSFREDVIEGETGYLCRPDDAGDLAKKMERFFGSPLYAGGESTHRKIKEYAEKKYSWTPIARDTRKLYEQLMEIV
jgi:glycosyltransferase involved in cell wall biosynthesis